ncbi:MAG: hypothetical protein NTW87_17130 [Planctomycetota bacterium]|nr:hypothetical protein [Planctomycetota bacterium]
MWKPVQPIFLSNGWPLRYYCGDFHLWFVGNLILDVVVAAAILAFAGLACEWFIRRWQRRPLSDAPKKGPWFQFHLSTAVVMMFAAGGVMYLNALPIWHYAGEQNGQEEFEISGYGWPCVVYDTGMSYGPMRQPSWKWSGPACNVVFMALVAAYVGMLCEWRNIARWLRRGLLVSTLLGLLFGGLCFWLFYAISTTPVVSLVSLSITFKPGWQNWRSGAAVFVVVVFVVLMQQASDSKLRSALSRQGSG